MAPDYAQCGKCSIKKVNRFCMNKNGKAPKNCPTQKCESTVLRALDEMRKPENYNFVRNASIQEGEGYGNKELGYALVKPIKPRIQETIEFAQKMNFRRLGLVFCIGLNKEAQAVDRLLCDNGFEVVSVCCKVGKLPKEEIGVNEQQKIQPGRFESMCNPIAQALVLNEDRSEFNILMGLCVGHDSLMLKYAQAPCTVLAVKDRLLGHNPLAAIYTLDSYYRSIK
jgi:uncharacterized metal-binding protein